MTSIVKMEKNGKILIPVSIRRALALKDSSDLVLSFDEEKQCLTIETREHALERIHALLEAYILPGTMLSEELMAERRAETKVE